MEGRDVLTEVFVFLGCISAQLLDTEVINGIRGLILG